MTNFPNYIYWQLSDNLQPDFASLSLCCSATLIFFELTETHQVQTFEPTCKFKGFNEVQLPHNQGIAIYCIHRETFVLSQKSQLYTKCQYIMKYSNAYVCVSKENTNYFLYVVLFVKFYSKRFVIIELSKNYTCQIRILITSLLAAQNQEIKRFLITFQFQLLIILLLLG